MIKDISFDQLVALIVANLNYDNTRLNEINRQVNEALGEPTAKASDEDTELMTSTTKQVAELLARRLLDNNPNVPLYSDDDLEAFINQMIKTKEADSGMNLEDEETAVFIQVLKGIFKAFMDAIVQDSPEQLYSTYLQWVETVITVARERCQDPAYLASTQEGVDEVTRRLYTMDEYISLRRKALASFLDENFFRKAMVESTVAVLASSFDEDELAELRTAVETQIEPMIKSRVPVSRQITERQIADDITRIYD